MSFRIFLGILIFCPLAFGTVETWSLLVMEAGIFAALLLRFSSGKENPGQGILKIPGILPLFGMLCYMSFQITPLPPAFIGHISPAAFRLYSQTLWVADPGAWATLSLYPKGTFSEFLRLSSYAAAYILTVQALSQNSRLRRTAGLLSAFASGLAFFSILQHLVGNNRIYWIRELTQGGSLFGPYVNRNHFAGFMIMLFPTVMALFLFSRPSSREESVRKKVSDILGRPVTNVHLLLGLGALLTALSVFLSLSRGGILSLCVSLGLLGFLLSRRVGTRKGGLFLAAAAIVILYAVGWFGWSPIFERFRSVRTAQGEISELRLDVWKDSLNMVRDFPLTGTGAGSFESAYPAYRTIRSEAMAEHAHNDHLELLTDNGLVGVALLAWFLAAVLRRSYQAFLNRKDPYARHLFAGSVSGIAAFLMHGLTDFNFFIGANGLYFFVLLGLAVAAAQSRSGIEEQPPAQGYGSRPARKYLLWASGALLMLSIMFNSGQMLASVLKTEASRVSTRNASPENLAYLRDTLVRASFLDPLEPLYRHWLCSSGAAHSDRAGEYDNCIRAVRLSPSNAVYLKALGSALEEAGSTVAADNLYSAGVSQARTDAGALRNYAGFLLRAGKKEAALTQYRSALALEPGNLRAYTKLLILEGLSDADISRIIPENADSKITFAEYLEATGSMDMALAAYREAAALLRKSQPASSGIYWRISGFAARRSRPAEALDIMQSAEKQFPQEINIRSTIAGYAERLGKKEIAEAEYRNILRLDPENKAARERLKAMAEETTQAP